MSGPGKGWLDLRAYTTQGPHAMSLQRMRLTYYGRRQTEWTPQTTTIYGPLGARVFGGMKKKATERMPKIIGGGE